MTAYEEVRDRVLYRQPQQLREYRERQKAERRAALEAATTEPDPHDPGSDQLEVGHTRQVFDVPDARKAKAPEHQGRRRRPRREFCVYHNVRHKADEACGIRVGNLQVTRR